MDQMGFAALSERFEELVSGLRNDLLELAALAPVLKDKAKAIGLSVETDFSALQAAVAQLAPAASPSRTRRGAAPAAAAAGKRGKGKAPRFRLVYADGAPVKDADGAEIVFHNKVTLLRGPKYVELLGARIGEVRLVDAVSGAVVVDSLTLGPAPGGRPRR
jgi:hypothetical protein